ncbi:MAG: YggT family protein [Candidatus Nanopelagicales bacterium]|jgi:YggT family protein
MGSLLYQILWLYLLVMIGRLVFDYVQMFARSWRPSGFILVLVEFIYSLTDPPLKFFRRFVPPLRIGSISLDLSFLIVIILIQIAMSIVASL